MGRDEIDLPPQLGLNMNEKFCLELHTPVCPDVVLCLSQMNVNCY